MKKILYKKMLDENYKICPNCNYYFRLNVNERINLICDKDSFIEFNKYIESENPLNFPGYDDKLKINKDNLLFLSVRLLTGWHLFELLLTFTLGKMV